MAETAFTDLYPYVMTELPGCSKAIVLQRIRDVVIEFCKETQVYTCELEKIWCKTDVATYELDVASDLMIDTIKSAYLNGIELVPFDDYTMPSRREITLVDAPTSDTAATDEGLVVTVVLRPRRTATHICCELWEMWYETWAAGVKAALMAQTGKKWSNPSDAAGYRAEFVGGMAEARHDEARGKMNVSLMAYNPDGWEV